MAIYSIYPEQDRHNDNRHTSYFELILKCSFVIVLLGIVNLMSYYYVFNIPITAYLEMTEINTLFLDQLPNYVLLLIPVLFLLQYGRFLLFTLSLSLLALHLIIFNTRVQAEYQFLVVCAMVYGPVFPYFTTRIASRGCAFFNWYYTQHKWKLINFMFISSVLCTGINGLFNAMLVKNRILYCGTKMMIDGKEVIADSSVYYVGQTRNYLFWYDARESTPIIYPAGKLEKLVIKTIDIEKPFKSKPAADCDSVGIGACTATFP